MITTTINTQSYTFEVRPDETAIEVIRDRAKLTGTKFVCGSGVCGACTVLVDGVPKTSCLLPAHALEGRKVQTVEAHSVDNLHPVQRAFMAHDGLQCGFCTPGFIVESIAFYERWRKEHGTTAPAREEIADSMAGHLCRCGAYVAIYTAIQRACAGDFDNTDKRISPRVEAVQKVTGQAKYTVDVHYEKQLVGKILRSPHASAKILSIDTTAAKAMDGVKAVVELLDRKRVVRYVGQEIAAVAAIDVCVAKAALAKIKVDYDVHPSVFTIADALADNAPRVYPEFWKRAPSAGEGLVIPGWWRGNRRKPWMSRASRHPHRARKAIKRARREGDSHLVEGTWHTSAQIHTALEPHACVAKWDSPDRVTIHVSTQACHRVARQVAKHFNLRDDHVQLLCQHVGGGFGAKLEMTGETIAAVSLAREALAPVAVILDRLEEMSITGYRPPADIELALAADKQGKMKSLMAHAYVDSGVGISSMIGVSMIRYAKAPRDVIDYDVVTNLASGKPFRGPGAPLACWSLEQAVDEIAHKLGRSPTDLRRQWDSHEQRLKLYDWVDSIPAWRDRGPVAGHTGRFRRGIGIAAGRWDYFYNPDTYIKVQASAEGISATTAAQDMGTGSRTIIAQVLADVFDVSPLEVQIDLGNSLSVRGPMSAGSRTTNSVYFPAYKAATEVRDKLLLAATRHFGLTDVAVGNGGIRHAKGHLTWQEVLQTIPPVEAVAKRGNDSFFDFIKSLLPLGADDINLGKGEVGAVYVSEVEVDSLLGKIRVLRVWGGLAVGRIHAPKLAHSQCLGGVIQGIGYALYEERNLDPATGTVLSRGLEEYRIPGIGDIPLIEIYFLEEGFDHARGKGVGLAEISTAPVAASVGNAVFHATGWRPYELPIRPDRVIRGLKSRQ